MVECFFLTYIGWRGIFLSSIHFIFPLVLFFLILEHYLCGFLWFEVVECESLVRLKTIFYNMLHSTSKVSTIYLLDQGSHYCCIFWGAEMFSFCILKVTKMREDLSHWIKYSCLHKSWWISSPSSWTMLSKSKTNMLEYRRAKMEPFWPVRVISP